MPDRSSVGLFASERQMELAFYDCCASGHRGAEHPTLGVVQLLEGFDATGAAWQPSCHAQRALRLQGGSNRLQHGKVPVVADVGGFDLNVQSPCPVSRPATYLLPVNLYGLVR